MTVYFYHTQNLNYIYSEWKAGRFPSHLLYGACELKDEGIDVIFHKHTNPKLPRWKRMIIVAWNIITTRKHFDAIYATKQNGLDLIILLRALGLFRKPVIIWHHQPILTHKSFIKRCISKIYHRGIDHMFMFSDNIVDVSLATGIVSKSKLEQCPWGTDLDFYDRLMASNPTNHEGFISTGKENRDFPTLIKAFASNPDQHIKMIVPPGTSISDYEKMFPAEQLPDNINIIENKTMWIRELALNILPHKYICICCKKTNYTVGLTTLVEALAFGFPVIISRNENQPFDASTEGCGISVDYNDLDGWCKAIRQLADNPEYAEELGKRGRQMAEETYNIRNTARIVARRIKAVLE